MSPNPESGSRSYDHLILISALTLLGLGLTMVFNASTVMAQAQYQDPYYFIKRQALYALLGIGVLFLGRTVDYHRYQRLAYPFLFLSLICLVLVFIPGIGGKVRGAARWLKLGPFTLQPSEFAKLAVALFLAYSLTKKQEKMKFFSIGFLPHMMVAGVFIILVGLEPDFGTAITIAAIVFTMLFIGGTRLTHIMLALGSGVGLAVIMVLRDPKKMGRVFSYLDPWKYGQDVGYQLKQSLLAIGSGGLWGMGPGQSRAKLFYLPDAHTDFIISIFSEETGFLGVMLVLILFGVLVYRGFLLSFRAPDSFGSYLALGLTLLIGLPAVINLGVVSGIFPTKGLSLPFLSYGGSSLLANLLAVGILLNISSRIKRPGLTMRRGEEKQGNVGGGSG
ncbi:MAG: putative lipid II flippase FtsW [Deltaproteobacteria bacterium]|nr:putative lipid II flippase FtsW [Deltaproteobacteria bacterium]MBI4795813.1 putative lipid II flippase FtsW [Deltaproteobacteria bacterium]